MTEFCPDLTPDTDYTYALNEKAYNRANQKLEETKGTNYSVLLKTQNSSNFCIPPTIVSNVDWDDDL